MNEAAINTSPKKLRLFAFHLLFIFFSFWLGCLQTRRKKNTKMIEIFDSYQNASGSGSGYRHANGNATVTPSSTDFSIIGKTPHVSPPIFGLNTNLAGRERGNSNLSHSTNPPPFNINVESPNVRLNVKNDNINKNKPNFISPTPPAFNIKNINNVENNNSSGSENSSNKNNGNERQTAIINYNRNRNNSNNNNSMSQRPMSGRKYDYLMQNNANYGKFDKFSFACLFGVFYLH